MRGVLLCASILLAGCVAHRGAGWRREPDPREPGAATLVVLGDAGAAGNRTRRVAGEVERVLGDERRAGRPVVVLWVGDSILPPRDRKRRPDCPDPKTAWSREGVRELAAAVRRHVDAGGSSFGTGGDFAWRCGHADALVRNETGEGQPFAMPAMHYVVRVHEGGETTVVTTCGAQGCTRAPARTNAAAVADLVMVDLVPYVRPKLVTPARREAHVRALHHVLESLAEAAGPPRILVSQVPIEAANDHGLGGLDPIATWHNLPPGLRAALREGAFVGAIGALDRSSYVEPDLGPAIQRSDKAFVAAPIWQVVAGAASRPNARAGAAGRRIRYFRGIAYEPDLVSDHLGFAIVRLGPTRTDVTLRVRKGRRFRSGALAVPGHAAAKPREVATPPMQPCLRCREVPASERRDANQ